MAGVEVPPDEVFQDQPALDSPGAEADAPNLQAALEQMDAAEVTQEHLQGGPSFVSLPGAEVTHENLPSLTELAEPAAEQVAETATVAPGPAKGSRPSSTGQSGGGLPSKVSTRQLLVT